MLEAAGKPCKTCGGLHDEPNMVICERCDACYHIDCLDASDKVEVHDGPWLCPECKVLVMTEGASDILYDFSLTNYLFLGQLPTNSDEANRV